MKIRIIHKKKIQSNKKLLIEKTQKVHYLKKQTTQLNLYVQHFLKHLQNHRSFPLNTYTT